MSRVTCDESKKSLLVRVHVPDNVLSPSQSHHSNSANPATSLSHAANEASIAESLDDRHTTPLGFTILIHDCRDADIPLKWSVISNQALVLSIQHVLQTKRCTFDPKCPDICVPGHRYLKIHPAGNGEGNHQSSRSRSPQVLNRFVCTAMTQTRVQALRHD